MKTQDDAKIAAIVKNLLDSGWGFEELIDEARRGWDITRSEAAEILKKPIAQTSYSDDYLNFLKITCDNN